MLKVLRNGWTYFYGFLDWFREYSVGLRIERKLGFTPLSEK